MSLESFVKNKIQKCDLLKIDCEGLEYEILESLESELYAKIQRIVLEYHNGCPRRIEKLRRKLESEGFFVETLIPAYSRVQGLLRCWRHMRA
jgi:hypothetical protein